MDESKVRGKFEIAKVNNEKRIAFGWAYMTGRADGSKVIDHSGDTIDIYTLETAAYNYVENYRDGSEMHERGGIGVVVESMVFTPEKIEALGLMRNALPLGWWCGIKITDDGVWEKVKNGTYRMFSIEGHARREVTEDE